MGSQETGGRRSGEGGCPLPDMMIQLYHSYDTATVAWSDLESARRSATGATPGATRVALLRADGPLHRGRGGARSARRPPRAATCRRAVGVPLVHRARPPSVAQSVSPR